VLPVHIRRGRRAVRVCAAPVRLCTANIRAVHEIGGTPAVRAEVRRQVCEALDRRATNLAEVAWLRSLVPVEVERLVAEALALVNVSSANVATSECI
jgi:hypothetical protein